SPLRLFLLVVCDRHSTVLHSFPPRRSSDLPPGSPLSPPAEWSPPGAPAPAAGRPPTPGPSAPRCRTFRSLSEPGAAGEEEIYARSEEHTSELQSRFDLVCRLLLDK